MRNLVKILILASVLTSCSYERRSGHLNDVAATPNRPKAMVIEVDINATVDHSYKVRLLNDSVVTWVVSDKVFAKGDTVYLNHKRIF